MRSKKILITGGTGFVGANLVHRLVQMGYRPTLFIRKQSNLWRLEDIKEKIDLIESDLLDKELIQKEIFNLKPDFIYHLATYGANQSKDMDFASTFDTNFIASINLLEACAKVGFKYFVNTGSSSEYGLKDSKMVETDVLEPVNIYGAAKGAFTISTNVFSQIYKLPIVTLRLFSPYGYFEDENRFIPTVVKGCLQNDTVNLSNPDYVRDFVFIDDVVDAYIYFLEGEKYYGEIFNIGSGKQEKLGGIVNLIEEILNKKNEINWKSHENNQLEPKKWVADISKAEKLLNWTPKNSLKSGLKKYIVWL